MSTTTNESLQEPQKMTYEQSILRLEGIVRQLQDGQTELETALRLYEEGISLSRRCHHILGDAKRRIDILQAVGDDGHLLTAEVAEESIRTM